LYDVGGGRHDRGGGSRNPIFERGGTCALVLLKPAGFLNVFDMLMSLGGDPVFY